MLWDRIAGALSAAAPEGATLAHLRLYEADDLYVDYFGATA